MIELRNISLEFEDRVLVKNASSVFRNGSFTALIGRNGSGKSTLLRAIASLGRLSSGSILLDGVNISTLSPENRAKSLAFVSTEKVRVPNLCCRDLVALGRAPYTNWIGRMQKEDEEIVMNSLEAVGMADFASRKLEQMSDGECQRVMIARALAQNTPNILLDEPTSFLDIPNRHEICQLLADLTHSHGKCVIYSTHEIDVALNVCDSIALIDTASIIHLPTIDFSEQNLLQSVFGICVGKLV